MADSEELKYSFSADVSALQSGVNKAIKMLEKYEGVVKTAEKQGRFDSASRSVAAYQKAVSGVTKEVQKMAQELADVGSISIDVDTSATQALEGTINTVARQMQTLQQAASVTTSELAQMTWQMKSLKVAYDQFSPSSQSLVSDTTSASTALAVIDTSFAEAMESARLASEATKELSRQMLAVRPVDPTFADGFNQAMAKVKASAADVASVENAIGSMAADSKQDFASLAREVDVFQASIKDLLIAQVKDKFTALGTVITSRVVPGLKQLGTNTVVAAKELSARLKPVLTGMKSVLTTVTNSFLKLKTAIVGTKNETSLLTTIMRSFVAIKIGQYFGYAVTQSMNYIENLNLFTVAMDGAIDAGNRFVTTMQELYGLDPSSIMHQVGYFYQLAAAIDMPSDSAAVLSMSLTKLSTDLASLFNVNLSTVYDNLSSGMSGEARAVKKYGLDIRSAALQQTALSLGIDDYVETMTEANKQGLRFITMMNQAENATGDFARTIESPANQLKILGEQLAQLGRAIGSFFIGPMGVALQYLNGFIMALRVVLTFLGDLVGVFGSVTEKSNVQGYRDMEEGISGVGDAADAAAEKMQNLVAPFDELNILQEQTSAATTDVGGIASDDLMDPRIAEAIAEMDLAFEDIYMKANQVRDAILDFLGFEHEAGVIISWDQTEFDRGMKVLPLMMRMLFADIYQWGADLGTSINTALASIDWNQAGVIIGTGLESIIVAMNAFLTTTDWSSVGASMANMVNGVVASIDFDRLGETIGTYFMALPKIVAGFLLDLDMSEIATSVEEFATSLFDTMTIAMQDIDWKGIGDQIATFLAETDWSAIATSFATAMGTAFGGVVSMIYEAIKEPFNTAMEGLVDEAFKNGEFTLTGFLNGILSIASGLWDWLWTNLVAPFIDAVGAMFGITDASSTVMEAIGDSLIGGLFQGVINAVETIAVILGPTLDIIVNFFTGALTGITEFITGVFNGDWKLALQGLLTIFATFGNTIIGAMESAVNAVIWVINQMISFVWTGITNLVNSVLKAVEDVADIIGIDLDIQIGSKPPAIGNITAERFPVPALATGGVVKGPTTALIGEGLYDEAVVPLGNSPEFTDMKREIAAEVGGNNDPVEVHVYIGDTEWDAFTYKSAKRGERISGPESIERGTI